MEVRDRSVIGITHNGEPGVVIELRAPLPDFSGRHVVVKTKVFPVILRPPLSYNAVIADQRGRPMLDHMTRSTTVRL